MNGLIRTIFFVSALAPAALVAALVQLHSVGGTRDVICWIVFTIDETIPLRTFPHLHARYPPET